MAAMAANAASSRSPATHTSGAGSLSSACSQIRASSNSAKISGKFRTASSASAGSYAAPERRSMHRACLLGARGGQEQ